MKVKQAKKDGRQRWQGVKQLQMTFAGRRPLRSSALLKENGEMTKSPLEVKQRWHEYFSKNLEHLQSIPARGSGQCSPPINSA